MSAEQTTKKLQQMKLGAMAEAYDAQLSNPSAYRDMTFDERFGMIVDHESDVRASKKLQRLVNNSNMFFKSATPERINFAPERELDKGQVARLLEGGYMEKGQNIVITGPSGSGKTWLACAFGTAACRKFRTVKYYKMRSLIDDLVVCRAAQDGSYQKMLTQLKKTNLLIVDDFLLHEVSTPDMGEVLELVDARLLTGSTILCSQYAMEGWIKLMGRTAIAEALMSRITARSHLIPVKAADDMRLDVEMD